MFTQEQYVSNIYGGWYKVYTCTVCKKNWTNPPSIGSAIELQRYKCLNVRRVMEWDGSVSYAHVTRFDDNENEVGIEYQDGTKHIVSMKYLNSMLLPQ